ncbi:MAG: LysR family transcriptional regulator [Clostridiales bacterium]|nr:LysR family transcriptional regulator [Clostridiales bacterium]
MNFQNIEYFLAVVEYRNFTKAAQSLYISQQSLSENIRRLEEEIGTPLLNRGRTLTLTPAGECFVSGGRKILNTQDKMLREIAAVSNTCRSTIVLGVQPFDMPPFLPEAISRFTKQYPEYEVSVAPAHSTEVADLTFHGGPVEKGMEAIPLITGDPYAVVVNRALARQVFGGDWGAVEAQLLAEGRLAALQRLPFLLLCENKRLHPTLEALFQAAGFTPVEAFKSEDAGLLVSLCSTGTGGFLGPEDYCRRRFGALLNPEVGALRCYPLRDVEPTDLSVVYPKGKHLNQAEKRFVDVLRQVVAEEA